MPARHRFSIRCLAWVVTLLLAAAACQSAEPSPRGGRAIAAGRVAVLVLPFEPISDKAGDQEWLGLALQRSVETDLGASPSVRVLLQQAPPPEAAADDDDDDGAPPAGAAATDEATTTKPQPPAIQREPSPARDDRVAAALAAAARDGRAEFVVRGEFQLLERRLRVTGQVLDAQTGEAVGHLKVTGSMDELFMLQDELGEQALHSLPLRGPAHPDERRNLTRAPDPADTPYDGYRDRSYYSRYSSYYYGGSPYYYPYAIHSAGIGIGFSSHHQHGLRHHGLHHGDSVSRPHARSIGHSLVHADTHGGGGRIGHGATRHSTANHSTARHSSPSHTSSFHVGSASHRSGHVGTSHHGGSHSRLGHGGGGHRLGGHRGGGHGGASHGGGGHSGGGHGGGGHRGGGHR